MLKYFSTIMLDITGAGYKSRFNEVKCSNKINSSCPIKAVDIKLIHCVKFSKNS